MTTEQEAREWIESRRSRLGTATYNFTPPEPKICSVEICDRPAVTQGWCHAHYARWKKSGDLFEQIPIARSGPAAPRRRPLRPERLTCVCSEPEPDQIGECQNSGCRRPWFSPEYEEKLRADLAAGRWKR